MNNFIKTSKEIIDKGYTINEYTITADISIIAHFNNCVCLTLYSDCCTPLSCYNNTNNIGYMIRTLVEILDLSREDGLSFRKIENIKCSLIFDNEKCIGFGNSYKDTFILISDFVKINNL